MKKILTILVVLLVLAALGVGAYWYFDQQQRGDTGEGVTSIGDLFPFGRAPEATPGTSAPVVAAPNTPASEQNMVQRERLWKISRDPQSGAGIFARGGEMFVRFVDTATGNVYENKLGETRLTRISNTTVPKIREALWAPKGDVLIARYTNTADAIQTLHAKILPPKTTSQATARATSTATTTVATTDNENIQELQGTFLSPNILSLALFAPKERLLYIAENTNGSAVGFVSNLDGTKPVRLFESPIREWNVSWPVEGSAVITTKASAQAPGFSYLLNTKTGTMQRLLGGIRGLSVLPSADLTHVVYSESTSGGINLSSFDPKTGTRKSLARTLTEKCTWLSGGVDVACAIPTTFPAGEYPDDWYKGKTTFSDTFSRIDTENGRLSSLIDAQAIKNITEEQIDAVHLLVDQNGQFLVFTNKRDGSLWGFRLTIN